jgi:hypothetical protein
MFVIRVSYPGGHSVWLTRRFPTAAWGLKKDALPFPTEAASSPTPKSWRGSLSTARSAPSKSLVSTACPG